MCTAILRTECKAVLLKKSADATSFTEHTVNHVVAEKRNLHTHPFPSPSKRYKKTREHVNVDDFDTDAIRHTVHKFYERRENPTLDKPLQVLKGKRSVSRRADFTEDPRD